MYANEGGFSGVKLTVGRLEGTEGRKSKKMTINSGLDDTLKNFGEEVKIRNRKVTRKVIMRKVMFLKKRADSGKFEFGRKESFRKR